MSRIEDDYIYRICMLIYRYCPRPTSKNYEYRIVKDCVGNWTIKRYYGFPDCILLPVMYMKGAGIWREIPYFPNLTKLYRFTKRYGDYIS